MLNTPLAPWPKFSHAEIEAVSSVMRSNKVNYWTGDICRNFELDFASWAGTKRAISVSNGTLALDLALKGLKIGPGDEVIVTPRTFIASISCVVTAGATPVFADVDPDSGNICPETITERITSNTRAVIPVHLAGWPCEMDGIMALAKGQQIKVIEDCAQAHGARYKGCSVGSIGDVGAWSFCQDKIITTGGEGGMVTCSDEELWSKMWSYKDHGKSWDAVYNQQHPTGFRWLHENFGTNWRMLEMQAAIGRIQLKQLAEWTRRRTHIASSLRNTIGGWSGAIRCPAPSDDMVHAYYRLYAYVRPEGLRDGWDRDRIVEECSSAGAPIFQGSCPEVYLEKAFDDNGWRPQERLPVARELGAASMMFLTHPTITDEQLDYYCRTINEVFSRASR
jgi:dTDP-4-amino-4,6-dideoxygalactose transaminase